MYKGLLFLIFSTLPLMSCTYNVENSDKGAATTVSEIQASDLDLGLENVTILDQEATTLGITCSAHKYQMNLSKDLTFAMQKLDRDGALQSDVKNDVVVTLSSSKSILKCVAASSTSGKCQAKIDVAGKMVSKEGKIKKFEILKTSIMPTTVCEGAQKALKTASAEVVSDLLSQVNSFGQ